MGVQFQATGEPAANRCKSGPEGGMRGGLGGQLREVDEKDAWFVEVQKIGTSRRRRNAGGEGGRPRGECGYPRADGGGRSKDREEGDTKVQRYRDQSKKKYRTGRSND